jgi:CheY-like chemotaxis protein
MEIRLMARLFHINELRRDSLVVDDEPDVEVLFRQQFRCDLRADRYTMEFAQSAPTALQRITDASNRSLIRSCPTSTCRG